MTINKGLDERLAVVNSQTSQYEQILFPPQILGFFFPFKYSKFIVIGFLDSIHF